MCLTVNERRAQVGKQRDACDVRPFGRKGERLGLVLVQLRVEAKGRQRGKNAVNSYAFITNSMWLGSTRDKNKLWLLSCPLFLLLTTPPCLLLLSSSPPLHPLTPLAFHNGNNFRTALPGTQLLKARRSSVPYLPQAWHPQLLLLLTVMLQGQLGTHPSQT